jgi:hypothetical protein
MEQNFEHTIALLSRMPAALDALLRDLPAAWTLQNEEENTWSAFDVIGHLIHAERTNWMPRMKLVLESGESRPFEAFDRRGHQRETGGKSLGQLLDEFAQVRAATVAGLRALNPGPVELALRGQHPALGVVSLSQLLAAWAAHDLTHLHQISRIMAHQYRDAVGPWAAYLGVMQCAGHGS